MLQWGHDFSAVEIALLAAYVAAIKEELQWGHDFSAVEIFFYKIVVYFCWIASMGPRLFSRGNVVRVFWVLLH